MKKKSIILIGMAGVGKSTVGRLLADALGYEFTDLDDVIVAQAGKSLQDIIDDDGDSALLAIERRCMQEVDLDQRVVAPGGSIVYQEDLMNGLKDTVIFIYLQDTLENIEKRKAESGTGGVIGLKEKSFKEIFTERMILYTALADITVNVQGKLAEQVAGEILQLVRTI